MRKFHHIILVLGLSWLPFLFPGVITDASATVIRGRLRDASTGEPLEMGLIVVNPGNRYVYTDTDGFWKIELPDGRYTLTATYVGFTPRSIAVQVPDPKEILIDLISNGNRLQDVVITASESTHLTSSSLIDRDAMDHLQPSSFADLLELLPGQISQDPQMNQSNNIILRETGAVTATGEKSIVSDDYAITSLGTSFIVDGANINTDAGMNSLASAGTDTRSSLNRGVDMRTISTDNIESVEIIRGIPSSEYGNLTTGVVNIKRMKKRTPFTGRLKVDEFSKLINLGKGFGLGKGTHSLNLDCGFLDSKSDPRDNRETYRRLNGSARVLFKFTAGENSFDWSIGFDYTGSFDNYKEDTDLSRNRIDEYANSYNRFALTSGLIFLPSSVNRIESLELNISTSYVREILKRRVQVAPKRASVAPTTMLPGVSDGKYLLEEYIADYECDGAPVTAGLKLKESGRFRTGSLSHLHKAGTEWSFSKNFGRGQVYDLERPLSASWSSRPRRFSDIPALNLLSLFAEDNMSVQTGEFLSELQIGVRTTQLVGLDRRYLLSGKIYVDPRINLSETFPELKLFGRSMVINLGLGYGITTRLPTADYLFPQTQYTDFVELNHYDVSNPAEHSRIILRTYIDDPTNYNLRAARNLKFELRAGARSGGWKMNLSWFVESLKSGFRYSWIYAPYSYIKYDASFSGSLLNSSLDPTTLPSKAVSVLAGYRTPENGTRIDKNGIEFQLTSPRLSALRTALTVTGAWFHTRYSNSRKLYQTVTDVVGDQSVSDIYVGLYATDEGRVNEQFNTNFLFDTQIPEWGLIFSSSIQCMWWVKTRRMVENGVPEAYLSAVDGGLHPYMPSDREDLLKRFLVKVSNPELFKELTVPPAVYFNLKATKKIGSRLRISAFVNRIFDWLPDYLSNGVLIRRSSSAYFGMEAVLTL